MRNREFDRIKSKYDWVEYTIYNYLKTGVVIHDPSVIVKIIPSI